MKTFYLHEICPNKEFAQKIINRYEETHFYIEMPQWMYINEFESKDWASWWEKMYSNYNLIPGEIFQIIKE